MNDVMIEKVQSIKYLGVLLGDYLDFHKHADFVMKKLSIKYLMLQRVIKKNLYTKQML